MGVESLATLGRLLRLWRVHAYLDLLFVTRNARSLVIYYCSDVILGAAAVTATLLLAERFDGIGPWRKEQVIFMLGYAMLVWAGRRLALPVTPGWLALLALNLAASVTILLAFSYIWSSLAFWAPRA